TYGGLHSVLAVIALIALATALGLYYAVACATYWALSHRVQSAWAPLAFAACWLIAELARGTWLTGFGWGAIGYAHIDGPLAGFIPWVGAYGVTALAALLAALLAQRKLPKSPHPILLATLVLAMGWWLPQLMPSWSTDSGTLSVSLLQGNIAQDQKFESGTGVPQALQWYGEQLDRSRSTLVVAPETAIALLPQELPAGYWDAVRERFALPGQAALVGIPWGNYAQGYTNSVAGLRPVPGEVWRYDKHHLVPFGEFIPPWFKWFTRLMNIPLGDFNRGSLGQFPFEWAGQRISPNICYEDLFGEELGQRFADPAHAPTLFVNVSNLGWFGDTVIIDQHLQISRMRALEFERPFVRATNTGATVIMDHRARIAAALPRSTRGVLVGQVQGRDGLTPYAWWVARWGLWPLWLGALAMLLWGAHFRYKLGST
ncbi:MAG: apolipoprotein N-acyltransferase, partial [Rhodoferax sp.]